MEDYSIPEYRVWRGTLTSFGSEADGKHVKKSGFVLQATDDGAVWDTLSADTYRIFKRAGDVEIRVVDDTGAGVDISAYTDYQDLGNQAFRVTYTVTTNGTEATYTNEALTLYEMVEYPGGGIEIEPLAESADVGIGAITSKRIDTNIQSDNFVTGVSGWKIWRTTGNVEFGDGTFRGTVVAANGEIANFDIGVIDANTISADSGNFKLNSAIPYLSLGSATGFLAGTGFWVGKDGGVYKQHIGNPAGQYMSWDGSQLYVAGTIAGTVVAGGTDSNTWTINQDLTDTNVDLIFGRTTGGNAWLRWDGTVAHLNKDFALGESAVSNASQYWHMQYGGTAEEAPFALATNYALNAGVKGGLLFFGYNTLGDTSKIVAGVPHMHLSMEANYYVVSKHWFEYHLNLYNSDNSKAVRAMECVFDRDNPDGEGTWVFKIGKTGNAFFQVQDYDSGVLFEVDRANNNAAFNVAKTGFANLGRDPQAGIECASGIRAIGYSDATSGTGLELGWDGTNARIYALDHDAAAWKPVRINASGVGINQNPGVGVALSVTGVIQNTASFNTYSGNLQLNYLLSTYGLYTPGTDLGLIGYHGGALNVDLKVEGSTGNIILDPKGNDVRPNVNYDVNLGSLSKKYLTLHAAELWVETLVAQNTIATIGGRILVGPTNVLESDISAGAASPVTVTTKYNNLAVGDVVYMEANAKVEFFSVATGPTGTGPYTYTLNRNLDGSGQNDWYQGDALFNTGAAGDGFLDLYSLRGVKSASQAGPTIVGNLRNSGTYNDWAEVWAIGNLNGLYGYGATAFGAAFGKYASGAPNLTIDATNGIRIRNYTTTIGQWDTSGNILVGAAATENLYITSSALQLRDGATVYAQLSAAALTLGQTASEHVNVTATAVQIKDGANVYTDLTAGVLTLGLVSGGEYVSIDGTNGIRLYGGGTLNAQLTNAGVLTLGYVTGGEYVSIDGTNGIRLYGGGTLNVQLDVSGNVTLGQVATNYGNAFWNNTNKRFEFRGGTGGTVVQAYVATDGSIVAGSGNVQLNTTGIELLSDAITTLIYFKDSTKTNTGGAIGGQNTLGKGAIVIRANPNFNFGTGAVSLETYYNASNDVQFALNSSASGNYINAYSSTGTFAGIAINKSTAPNAPLDVNGNVRVAGAVIPNADNSYDIGTNSLRWTDVWISSGGSLDLKSGSGSRYKTNLQTAQVYVKSDKLVVHYRTAANQSRFYYITLTGTSNPTWTYSATEP